MHLPLQMPNNDVVAGLDNIEDARQVLSRLYPDRRCNCIDRTAPRYLTSTVARHCVCHITQDADGTIKSTTHLQHSVASSFKKARVEVLRSTWTTHMDH